ncbi:ARM repeat-containing protein [Microstroma glucosiphilum]|uniref:ARM repeat-containing protein n=1 Tax=Pseudomicrostroma glucosiphilum TaxID=1684307 RepID=A0A316U448_9BASI|nr:ARM repeat-containing protein [Pseudomicrostroma glucosiphilum]PWN19153.1 ARM repeat-containing protein [Pseudomicrostroma glucosiphilum]
MDPNLQKALLDRVYDKRKAATLDLERQVREALGKGDRGRVNLIVQQLCTLLSPTSPQNVNARNGGLIGLAGISIALGMDIAPYLEQIVPPVLACFTDPDSKIRYFACESFYNITKVCKGEILIYFNEIFDALSKLAADSEVSVKNGAELLDRLLKDIVCETAPQYVSHYQDLPHIRARQDAAAGYSGGSAELDVAREKAHAASHGDMTHTQGGDEEQTAANRTFSLARFVPLLAERMYVLSPFTRNYLVSWITVLDSVPDLELVSYLPSFLDGLLKYLSDPNTDVRLATANVLAEFLREMREAAESSAAREEIEARKQEKLRAADEANGAGKQDEENAQPQPDDEGHAKGNAGPGQEEESEEVWAIGREVRIDYASIMEVLIDHITFPDEEIQATTLQWVAELLLVVKDVVVPFAPRLIPAALPNLAHHSPAIQTAANETNYNLYQVIQELPAPVASTANVSTSPRTIASTATTEGKAAAGTSKSGLTGSSSLPKVAQPPSPPTSPRLSSTATFAETMTSEGQNEEQPALSDPFDYQTTVNMLALQLLDQHEETRVTALEWLIMLHQKAPQRILTMHDGTFPALLKTLSDPSEEVIRCDLRLLAQISSASEDLYFSSFMANLLSLFSTDRRLLETRGSLIIRQLCASLHTERIFRTLSELLEKDEDLEFAGIMVQNLNIILITSPELADFRRRLKNVDSKDGQQLFVSLYRSWCHNAVATFSLCLLSQAYEHASNLLQIFADLEITVAMLIQIDKLVQLLESPIFTSLRLQLLDPDKNPFLLKSLYGLLMLLPQSSAFATLRNRLSAVSSMGSVARSTYAQTARSKLSTRDEIKWPELLTHFRQTQLRHERARRSAAAAAAGGATGNESLVPGMAGNTQGGSGGGKGGKDGASVSPSTSGSRLAVGGGGSGGSAAMKRRIGGSGSGGPGQRAGSVGITVTGGSGGVAAGSRLSTATASATIPERISSSNGAGGGIGMGGSARPTSPVTLTKGSGRPTQPNASASNSAPRISSGKGRQ